MTRDELKPCPFCGGTDLNQFWVSVNFGAARIDKIQCRSCDAEALKSAWNARPAPQPSEGDRSWRCFHCDEVFTNKEAAREHFGSTELDEPGCKMLAKGEVELLRDYRDMAARWQRCVSEDCDASRIYHSMSAKIATTEREAEQRGYDKGLNDTRLAATKGAVPEGWQLVPKEPTQKMKEAADAAFRGASLHLHREWRRHDAHAAAYDAMLAAAPAPEVRV